MHTENINSISISTTTQEERFVHKIRTREDNREWFDAIEQCDLEKMKQLIDTDNFGVTLHDQGPSALFGDARALTCALWTGNFDVIKLVIEAGNLIGHNVAQQSIPHQDLDAQVACIEIRGKSILVERGITPLFFAGLYGTGAYAMQSLDTLELLLQNGANPNAYDGKFALIFACECATHPATVIDLFAQYGADLNAKNENGQSLFQTISTSDWLSLEQKMDCQQAFLKHRVQA